MLQCMFTYVSFTCESRSLPTLKHDFGRRQLVVPKQVEEPLASWPGRRTPIKPVRESLTVWGLDLPKHPKTSQDIPTLWVGWQDLDLGTWTLPTFTASFLGDAAFGLFGTFAGTLVSTGSTGCTGCSILGSGQRRGPWLEMGWVKGCCSYDTTGCEAASSAILKWVCLQLGDVPSWGKWGYRILGNLDYMMMGFLQCSWTNSWSCCHSKTQSHSRERICHLQKCIMLQGLQTLRISYMKWIYLLYFIAYYYCITNKYMTHMIL